MKDIMLDLETFDNVGTSTIASIGAVQCNLTTGDIGSSFYRVIDLQDQLDMGFTINAKTLYWWLEQSEAARHELVVEGKISIHSMCQKLNLWLESLGNPKGFKMWGNGCSFDNAILRHAYRKCKIKLPIEFWNDRDVRTLVGFYPNSLFYKWKKDNVRRGAHNAIADCKYQIAYCAHICKELGVKEIG